MTLKTLGRLSVVALGALSLGATATNPLGAQGIDSRWQAWTGCWAPVGTLASANANAIVCVVPAPGTSAVEVVTIVGGKVDDRTRIEADGIPHQVSRDGCTGTESATWASTGTRVYLTSDLTCSGGIKRTGKGVMSFSQRHEWLEVRGVQTGEASGVAVSRYAALVDTTTLPAEVARLVPARGAAANNAILAASSPLSLADIADISIRTDSGVATTWIVERTSGVKLSINGKQLTALADQGVPPAVIDVLVALAHPTVFALDANSREADFKAQAPRNGNASLSSYGGYYGNSYYYGWMSSRMSYGMYSPFYYGMYDPFYGYGFRYGSYGYSPGYGYNPYYGGYYPGSQPIIVVTRGNDNNGPTARPHGRVSKGQGYTEGRSGGGSSSGGSSSSASSSSSGSGSSAPASSGSASSGGSSGGAERTAVRKPPR